MARIESARAPIGPLSRFQIEELVDPRDTRRLVCDWVESAYRYISLADQLGPRSIQFRPWCDTLAVEVSHFIIYELEGDEFS